MLIIDWPILIYKNPEDIYISTIGVSTTGVPPGKNLHYLYYIIPPDNHLLKNTYLATALLTGTVTVELFRS